MKLIVGIDPGLNTGIACISIESGEAKTHTMRNASIGDICDYILSQGEPIIVASDVRHVPRAVKKISAAFNARLFYSQPSVSEKRQLAKNTNYSNVHERDAMAAAIRARKFFLPTFVKVDSALQRKGLAHLSAAVKEMLIKRKAGNIESALNMLMPVPVNAVKKKRRRVKIEIQGPSYDSAIFESKLKEKDEEIGELRKEIAILRSKNRDRAVEDMRKVIDSLRSELGEKQKQLETMKHLLTEGFEVIVPFREGEDVRDKIVLVERNTRMLGKAKPRAIITEEYFPANAPVILRKDIEIININDVLVANRKPIEELIEKQSFLQYLEKYKHRYEAHR